MAASPNTSELPPDATQSTSGNLGRAAEAPSAQPTLLNLQSEAPAKRRNTVVDENQHPRAEKLRDASIVVLDEASDDSGLRFVIVAALIFFLFIIFLLISKLLE